MFVTFEGIDGSGKSTVAERVHDEIGGILTCEPEESWLGEAARRGLRDEDISPLSDLFLHTAAHANHVENTINPALENGEHVISDRYVDSRFAYQIVDLKDELDYPFEYIQDIHEPITRFPDLTFLVDVSPKTAQERNGGEDKFEVYDFLESVRSTYFDLADYYDTRFVVIDGEQSKDEVFSDVMEVLEDEL